MFLAPSVTPCNFPRPGRIRLDSTQDECGEWVTALCPYGEDGCPDNEGDYDIVMPEPMGGVSGSGYKAREEGE